MQEPDFVKWVWLDEENKAGFVGGIYYSEKTGYHSSVLSDTKGLRFKDIEELKDWMLKEKRGEHETTNNG